MVEEGNRGSPSLYIGLADNVSQLHAFVDCPLLIGNNTNIPRLAQFSSDRWFYERAAITWIFKISDLV